ncbi:MAG: glycosyltransferase family 39 protein [Anaerolineae bacterium]
MTSLNLQFFRKHQLALVLLIAISVRLVIFAIFPLFRFEQTGAIHGSDAYDAYAQNLLSTGIYGREAGVADALIPPLYSYALAGVYSILGRGGLQVALFHTVLDSISIICLYHIGKRLLSNGATVGALAGLLYALYPYLVFQNLTVIDTPFFMTLLYLFVLLMVLLRERQQLDRGTWGLAAAGGLVLGLGMLTRPILPPLAVLMALWFLFRLNLLQTILRLLPVAVVSLAILGIWIVRNNGVYNAFVPMTTTSGANFWQGNSPYTIAYFRAGYDVQWTSPDVGQIKATDPRSREADSERFALALQFLRDNPDKIPELLWVKFLVYWSIDIAPRLNPTEGTLPRVDYKGNVIPETDPQGNLQLGQLPPGDPVGEYSTPLFDQIGRPIHILYWGSLLLLGLLGMAFTLQQWRDVSALWFVQISMTIVYLIFHPSTRYRVPTDPLLFLFSAYALTFIAARWRTGFGAGRR